MKILAKVLAMTFLVVAATACSGQGGPNPDLKEDIEKVLKDNPEVVLNILDEHKEELFDLVLAGQAHKQRRMRREQWKAELEQPATPPINEERPVAGDVNAPITIVEYSDFQCPYCSRAAQVIGQLLTVHEGQIRLVFKHNPLDSHENAYIAAQYFEAAGMQDNEKAWHLHDIMFIKQRYLEEGGEEWIREQAAFIGLDVEQLTKDANSDVVLDRIEQDIKEAEGYGFDGTPAFMVNGVSVMGALPMEDFEDLIGMIQAHESGEDAPADTPAE